MLGSYITKICHRIYCVCHSLEWHIYFTPAGVPLQKKILFTKSVQTGLKRVEMQQKVWNVFVSGVIYIISLFDPPSVFWPIFQHNAPLIMWPARTQKQRRVNVFSGMINIIWFHICMYSIIRLLWRVSPFGHPIKCTYILVHSQQNALDHPASP